MHKYESILHLPHYEPKNHPRMSIENRSFEFAPFSALAGFKDAIMESERENEEKVELDEYQKDLINQKLQEINKHLDKKYQIVYYQEDMKKIGGIYKKVEGLVKKIDIDKGIIIMDNALKIKIIDIVNIE